MGYEKYSQDHPQITAAGDWNPLVDAVNAISGVQQNATYVTTDDETAGLPSSLRHRDLPGTEKPVSYTIRRVGANYEAINGTTGEVDYGGAGNAGGVAGNDAQAVIQATINVLTSGGKILLKKATYGLNASIDLDDDIQLCGEGVSTVLEATGDFPVVSVVATAPDFIDNAQILDLKILGLSKTDTSADGIATSRVRFLYVNNVWIERCYIGMDIDYLWRPLVSDFNIYNCRMGIQINSPSGNSELKAINGHIRQCDLDGINIWDGAWGVELIGIAITDCSDTGLKINELNWGHFTQILVDTCAYGYYFRTWTNGEIRGIQMTNCWAGTITNEAFIISAETTTGIIHEIMIDGVQIQPPFTIGMYIGYCSDIQIRGGLIRQATTHGIQFYDRVSGATVEGMRIKECSGFVWSYAIVCNSGCHYVKIDDCDLRGNSNSILLAGVNSSASLNAGYMSGMVLDAQIPDVETLSYGGPFAVAQIPAHAVTHSGGGTDPVYINAGQIVSGVLAPSLIPPHATTHSGAGTDPVLIRETQIRSPTARADQLLIHSGSGWAPGDPWLGGYFPTAATMKFTGECFTERWEQGFRSSLYHGRTGSYWESESIANTPYINWTLPDIIASGSTIEPVPWNNVLRVRNSQDGIVRDDCYVGLYQSMKRGVLAFEANLSGARGRNGLYIGFEVNSAGSFGHLACLCALATSNHWQLLSIRPDGSSNMNVLYFRHSGVMARYALVYDPPVLEFYQAPRANPMGFPLQLTNTILIGEEYGRAIPFFAVEDPTAIYEMHIGNFWTWEIPAVTHHYIMWSGSVGPGGSFSYDLNCAGVNELAVTFRGHYNAGAGAGARVYLRGGYVGEYTSYNYYWDGVGGAEHSGASFDWFDPYFIAGQTVQITHPVQSPYPRYLRISTRNMDGAQVLSGAITVHVKGSDW